MIQKWNYFTTVCNKISGIVHNVMSYDEASKHNDEKDKLARIIQQSFLSFLRCRLMSNFISANNDSNCTDLSSTN